MIRHFESRLADVLGAGLDPPFQGRVIAGTDSVQGQQPVVTVAVVTARPAAADFGGRRPEMVPGANDPRRIVRLECGVEISVTPSVDGGRAQTLAGLDALLYLLEAPELQRPETLTSPEDDPGFVLESMRVGAVQIGPAIGIPRLELTARGWFWPPNAPGVSGRSITATHIRAAQLPVSLSPWPLRLRAGGDAISLVLDTGGVGTIQVSGQQTVAQTAFGSVIMRLLDAGGRPGAGTLSGGVAGPAALAGSRELTLDQGRTPINYQPPALATVDHLVVTLGRDAAAVEGSITGIELARFALEVEA